MEEICRLISLPEPVTAIVCALAATMPIPDLTKLQTPGMWEAGLEEVKQALAPDPEGFKMLTCMLLCAKPCQKQFDAWRFPPEVFPATMACFSRFVREHMVSYGCYGFDRDFWTVRQVSGVLFRIGELEYELRCKDGLQTVSLHIPSDARLALPLLRSSWERAKGLIEKTFPEYQNVPWDCSSWLLSPNLKDLLPPSSRILAFQRSFRLTDTYAEEDFREWVYKRTDIPNENLPETTSLQRNIKGFLLAGGQFLSGKGTLCENPFLPAE